MINLSEKFEVVKNSSSIQLYLTFDTFWKKTVEWTFFKSLRCFFRFISISTIQNFFKFTQEVENIANF